MDAPVTLLGKIVGNQNGVTWTLEPYEYSNETFHFRSTSGHISKLYTSLTTAIVDMRKAMKQAAKDSINR